MSNWTVFYSWHTDLPACANRNFIRRALDDATKAIREDATVEDCPRVDSATEGMPGAQNIAAAIFGKIGAADAFVADVSIIGPAGSGKRPTPNPNVLVGVGFAIGLLTWDRIVLVMNKTEHDDGSDRMVFDRPECLPFDLRQHSVVMYEVKPEDDRKAPERNRLAGVLEHKLRLIAEKASRRTSAISPSLREAYRVWIRTLSAALERIVRSGDRVSARREALAARESIEGDRLALALLEHNKERLAGVNNLSHMDLSSRREMSELALQKKGELQRFLTKIGPELREPG